MSEICPNLLHYWHDGQYISVLEQYRNGAKYWLPGCEVLLIAYCNSFRNDKGILKMDNSLAKKDINYML